MTAPLLSILIPTLDCRKQLFARLMACLIPQVEPIVPEVKVFAWHDDGHETIGAKRQHLLDRATTPYVAFVDDDDFLPPDFSARILAELRRDPPPDVVGFRVRRFVDGVDRGVAVHSIDPVAHARRGEAAHGQMLRPINHLNPIRCELALSIGFKDMNQGEDNDYAERLKARYGTTLREAFIDHDMYLYDYRSERDGERINQQNYVTA